MDYIFKKVKILDRESKFHNRVCDVWIKDGIIEDIKSDIPNNRKAKVYEHPGSFLSRGWIDVGALCGEPGYEHRETLENAAKAAKSGGYTGVCVFPNTKPCLHSKSEITYISEKSKKLPVHIYPIGAVSKSCMNEEMAEMLQMHEAGAIAFSDGKNPVQSSSLMMRALDYINLSPGSVLINQSLDKGIAATGQVHEGVSSTIMGLKGIPALAETTALYRDIGLLNYCGSKLLVHKVSCAGSVSILKEARKNTSNLFASVSLFNLIFEDRDVENFDVHLKLNPPLRTSADRKALIRGLKEGAIDIIVSDHTPWDPENIDLEFQTAAFGSINLQTAFGAYCQYLLDDLGIELWVEKCAHRVSEILNLKSNRIEIGKQCDLSWFETRSEWTFRPEENHSLSKNSPFLGKKLRGKVLGTFVKAEFHPNS